MQGLRQVDYPAIAKAQRLTAERLGAATRGHTGNNNEEEQRPFTSAEKISQQQIGDGGHMMPTAISMQQEHGSRSSSPPANPWIFQSGTARAVARGRRRRVQLEYANKAQQQRHINATSKSHTCCSERCCQSSGARSARSARSSSRRGERDARCGGGGLRSLSHSPSRSVSSSPPPPPPPRLGEERARSLERVVWDIGQISRSVRQEALTLERFLSLEVAPAVQKVFDAAVGQHAKACRLLRVDHLDDLEALDFDSDRHTSLHLREHYRRDGLNVGGSATNGTANGTITATTGGGSVGLRNDTSVSFSLETSRLNVSSTSTEAWQRAVRAGVIELGPRSKINSRSSLPARKSYAATTAAFSTASAATVTGSHAGGTRFSLGGRPVAHRQDTRGGNGAAGDKDDEKELIREARSRGLATSGGGSGGEVAAASAGRGGKPDDSIAQKMERGEEEEEEEGGDASLSKLVTDNISAKIVGLSSLIRRKAAEASQGRLKH